MAGEDLTSLTFAQLERWAATEGLPAFRGRQLFRWLHGRVERDFARMTDLSRELRDRLAGKYRLHLPEIVEQRRAADGTRKLRFRLADGLEVEGVYMPEQRRRTLCVSTQVGCAMGCAFCATGSMGLVRHLAAGEIAGQVEAVRRLLAAEGLERPVSNVVFMGMGEPLHNLEATLAAVEILLHPLGGGMSRRHLTVSTAGLVPAMKKFVERVPARLAVSLNAADDEVRSRLMPINRRYPLERLLAACRELNLKHTDRITFEYVLLGGINDGDDDARRLVKLLSGLSCKVNLIPYNPLPDSSFRRPRQQRLQRFQQILLDKNLSVFVRRSRGAELAAACGQLVTTAGGGAGRRQS